MPCLAIADNPSNPSWKAYVAIIVSLSQNATFESIRTDFAIKRYSKLFNLEIAVIYIACFFMSSVGLSEMRERGDKGDTRGLRQKHYISSLGQPAWQAFHELARKRLLCRLSLGRRLY